MSRTMTMTMNSTGSQCSRMVEVSTPVAPPPPLPLERYPRECPWSSVALHRVTLPMGWQRGSVAQGWKHKGQDVQ